MVLIAIGIFFTIVLNLIDKAYGNPLNKKPAIKGKVRNLFSSPADFHFWNDTVYIKNQKTSSHQVFRYRGNDVFQQINRFIRLGWLQNVVIYNLKNII